jgi:predicted HAD superfamily Cof-like phosphohydrolase
MKGAAGRDAGSHRDHLAGKSFAARPRKATAAVGEALDPQACVRAFHARYGVPAPEVPGLPDPATARMRLRLIREETDELASAFAAGDLVAVADAIADLLYVTVGTAVTCGIDLRPVFAEVHRSNMTKDAARGPGADGKVVKGPGFRPPDLAPLLRAQGWKDGAG